MAIDRRVTIGVSQVVGLSSLLAGKAGEDDPPEPHAAMHLDGAADALDVTQLGGYPAAVTRAAGQAPLVLGADRTWQSPMPHLPDQQVLAAPPGGGEADAVGLGPHLSIDQGQLLVTGDWTASYVIQHQPIAHQLARQQRSAEFDYGTQPEYLPNAVVLSELPTGYLRSEAGTGDLQTRASVPVADLGPVAAGHLLGRTTAASGPAEVLAIGAGLELQGTTLVTTAKNSGVYGYGFSSQTVEPPAKGTCRFNAAHPYTGVTKVWVSILNSNDEDLYFGWMRQTPNSELLVQDKDTHQQFAQFVITNVPIDKGSYIEVPVGWTANGVALVNNQDCLVRVLVEGGTLAVERRLQTLETQVASLLMLAKGWRR